jgi:hypothetical protein
LYHMPTPGANNRTKYLWTNVFRREFNFLRPSEGTRILRRHTVGGPQHAASSPSIHHERPHHGLLRRQQLPLLEDA